VVNATPTNRRATAASAGTSTVAGASTPTHAAGTDAGTPSGSTILGSSATAESPSSVSVTVTVFSSASLALQGGEDVKVVPVPGHTVRSARVGSTSSGVDRCCRCLYLDRGLGPRKRGGYARGDGREHTEHHGGDREPRGRRFIGRQ